MEKCPLLKHSSRSLSLFARDSCCVYFLERNSPDEWILRSSFSLSFASPPLEKGDIASNGRKREGGLRFRDWQRKLRKFLLDTCRLRWIIVI